MTLLKTKLITSGESLRELNSLFNKITECAAPAGADKNLFMTEVTNLKMEARRLLDEVNEHGERSPNEDKIFNSNNGSNIFEEVSFKQKLNDLKQKINALSLENIALQ